MSKLAKTDYDALANYKIGGGKVSEWFKPQVGADGEARYTVRLVPSIEGEPLLYDTDMHYFELPEKKISGVCPRATGATECPACEVFFKHQKAFPYGTPEQKVISNIGPKTRVYVNLVERQPNAPETERIQIWSMSYTSAKQLLEQINVNAGDKIYLADPDEGRDLILKFKKQGWGAVLDLVSVRGVSSPLGLTDPAPFSLVEKAHQKDFTVEEVTEALPDALGQYADAFLS